MIKRLSAFSLKLATMIASLALGLTLSPSDARADIVFYEKDGWGVYTRGLVGAHYQLALGDPDPPTTHGLLVGGKGVIRVEAAEEPVVRVDSGLHRRPLGDGSVQDAVVTEAGIGLDA